MVEAIVDPAPARLSLRPLIWRLLRPSKGALVAMLTFSVLGSLVGLVPPLALGRAIDALAGSASGWKAMPWISLIAIAVLLEAGSYVVSDGLYARVASGMYRDLRRLMFQGLLRRGVPPAAYTSRFVSDAETLEHTTVAAIDQGAVSFVDLVTAVIALDLIASRVAVIALAGIAAAAVLLRRLQRPASAAGQRRQEALEEMACQLDDAGCSSNAHTFGAAIDRLAVRERRLGWIMAANRHGNLAAAGLGPLGVLVAAALRGGLSAGTLLAAYLLAARAFNAVENVLDVSLDIQAARGAGQRCLELIDDTALLR